VRSAQPELDARHHLCTVHYRFDDPSAGELVEERHIMRFFFPMEIDLLLTEAGFELVSLTQFGSLDDEPAPDSWNVFAIARAT
jgi:hypothetical protein